MQIKNILIDRKEYSEKKADEFIKQYENKPVYELLVLKKELSNAEIDCRPVGVNSSIWHEEEDY